MKVNNNILRVSWLCTCLLLLFSAPLRAQKDNRLTLELNQASLAEFVKAVEGATDYTFIYSEDVKLAEPITMNVRNATLKNVLNTAFEGQPVKFEIEDHHILLMRQRAQIRNVVLSGRVTDASTGEPLVGVSIYNPQRRTGTTTNANGYYTLTQPNNVDFELVFSYVGYASKTHQLKLYGNRQLNVALEPGTTLQEVEVYGTRHNFGVQSSQMSTIAMSVEQIRKMPALLGEVDVLKSLQKLPGVQSAGDGKSGIYVRGGDYDQNLFLMDGFTLYNPEHLQGFTSAINADMVDDVVLYKGAFPAKYGGRLSSVVDIGLREGDMEKHRAVITTGILASRIQAEGPLHRGTTSYNISARISYFNAIVRPMLKEVIYDNPGQMNAFNHMKYYDLNAKVVHRLSDDSKLSALFYFGKDVNNATPNETSQHFEYDNYLTENRSQSSTENNWRNLVGSISYTHQFTPTLILDASIGYSGYNNLKRYNYYTFSQTDEKGKSEPYSMHETRTITSYLSKIADLNAKVGLTYLKQENHEFRGGLQLGSINLTPSVDASYSSSVKGNEERNLGRNSTGNRLDSKGQVLTLAAFVEDDWIINGQLRANLGLRLQGYNSDGELKLAIEPRASLRWLVSKNTSLKASYTHMSQGMFLLSSGNLINPSDIWIPLYKGMGLGTSDQLSAGISQALRNGIQLSVEGYYKWMDNVVDYKEGSSAFSGSEWVDIIAQGSGRTYGVELMAQKTIGNTTGTINYTWSKSLRTFDRPGMILNGGREFYATSDRRHGFNITLSQRLSKNWDLSAAWTYQSGRRANFASTAVVSPLLDEFNNYVPSDSPVWDRWYSENPTYRNNVNDYYQDTYVHYLVRMNTYEKRNGYVLPAVHRLDVSLSHHGSIGIGEMIFDMSIYNLYNQQNISTVYWGYENNRRALKGVCMFPIMPSVSLTLKL